MLFTKMGAMGLGRGALSGKGAIVTGAGRGIGKDLARALAWLGAGVVIAEISDSGSLSERQIRDEGGSAIFVPTDVSSEKDMERLKGESLGAYGRVDILVNNAIVMFFGNICDLPQEAWERTFAVNVQGAVLGIRNFLPEMLDRREGTIVTVTSAEGMPYYAPYFASKRALRSLALSLAAELGEDAGVSSFCFAPGMVDTPGGSEAFRKLADAYGMTYEEFTNQGVNPGYEGLMPSEDCAAGFAFTIVHARHYHGQVADPFRPLDQAGLLRGGG
ncbi:MAG: SDR family oxidoreductase [Dehalococcoidia bacterium]|nr:SDR family oxidoreductase [Dehalococcoidia bacterium]